MATFVRTLSLALLLILVAFPGCKEPEPLPSPTTTGPTKTTKPKSCVADNLVLGYQHPIGDRSNIRYGLTPKRCERKVQVDFDEDTGIFTLTNKKTGTTICTMQASGDNADRLRCIIDPGPPCGGVIIDDGPEMDKVNDEPRQIGHALGCIEEDIVVSCKRQSTEDYWDCKIKEPGGCFIYSADPDGDEIFVHTPPPYRRVCEPHWMPEDATEGEYKCKLLPERRQK